MTRRVWVLIVAAGLTASGCGTSGDDATTQHEPVVADDRRDGSASSDEPGSDDSDAADVEVAEPASPDASPYILAFGDLGAVSLPAGDPGEVPIVWSAESIDRRGSVTMIVRNNTAEDIGRIDVTGTARNEAGDLVGSGASQGFEPAHIAPGEIAFGYVYFDTELADSGGYEFSFDVDAEPADEAFVSKLPVAVTELNNTGDQLVGIVANELDADVGGPIGAAVLCFDAGGNVIDYTDGFLEQDELPAGASGSFSIELFDRPCPAGLVAASGFDF